MAKAENTAAVAERLAQPVLESLGLELWDVTYEKEGSVWYLRYYIDKPDGLTIEDCEAFSRAMDKLLDEADPIEGSYTLEVSSPGLERALTRDSHFASMRGKSITVRLVRPDDAGRREYTGILADCADGVVTLSLPEGGSIGLKRQDAAWIRQSYED